MSSSKTIAKNTLFLFCRMIITIIASLYTSRIVLEYLGVDDFGLYNVVGGIVAMLTFINSAMSSATQRFLSISLVSENIEEAKNVFNAAMMIHIGISIIFLIIAETLGLWFVLNKINIPEGRYFAAQIVYHFSVVSAIISFINVPYNASLVASEKMAAFAYISVAEAFLKLLVAFSLVYFSKDKLILYSILICGVQIVIRFLYYIYCKRNVLFCQFSLKLPKDKMKEMFGYSSWMFFGTSSQLLSTQGVNVLINLFFSVVINASRGIAVQVSSIVEGFVTNFMTAVQPRLMKLYAAGEVIEMNKLISQASRFGFILVSLLVFPLLIETEFVIQFWLGQLPIRVVLFIRLVLANIFIVVLYSPLASVIFASGKVKVYQLCIACCFLMVFILTYFCYYLGLPDYCAFVVTLVLSTFGLMIRLLVLKRTIVFSIKKYMLQTILPLMFILLSGLLPFLISLILNEGFLKFIIVVLISTISIIGATWVFVANKEEKNVIKNVILKYVSSR
ncbi:hypothetical protein ACPDHN_10965 [Myroides odoratimimus]|uniref:hypothetical protein n=1 Tax=Myroides odoratimimus TaxID=76832 RepID=UPI0029C0EFCE|nr:hypothetical protein [Myroides odoratimimus]MDX4975387.1 hypothetical protein [Myroides odoratimimus]